MKEPQKAYGGVAVVRVGASNEVELKEKKARLKTHCLQPAALEEGVPPVVVLH